MARKKRNNPPADPVVDEVASYGSNADELLENGKQLVRKGQMILRLPPTASNKTSHDQIIEEISTSMMEIANGDYTDDDRSGEIDELVAEMEELTTKMVLKFCPPSATPAVPSSPAIYPPAKRPQYAFPVFEGSRAEYHGWTLRLARYIQSEQPPQSAVYRWLKYEITPGLPITFRSQLGDATTADKYLQTLKRIYGSTEAALELAHKKMGKLTSFKTGQPEDTLAFFNELREMTSKLNFLDFTFPDQVQAPSQAILCRCNMEKVRGKLNAETDAKLVDIIMEEGDFCPPKKIFSLLLSLEEVTCKKAHLALATDKTDHQRGKDKAKPDTGQAKSVKAARQRQPSPRRQSPQRGQKHQSDPTASQKVREAFCRVCEASEHGTFNRSCPLAQGQDPNILDKLAARKVCTRCVRPQETCLRTTCNGGFNTLDGNFVKTDCKTCQYNGKPVNAHLCGHDGENQAPVQQ